MPEAAPVGGETVNLIPVHALADVVAYATNFIIPPIRTLEEIIFKSAVSMKPNFLSCSADENSRYLYMKATLYFANCAFL